MLVLVARVEPPHNLIMSARPDEPSTEPVVIDPADPLHAAMQKLYQQLGPKQFLVALEKVRAAEVDRRSGRLAWLRSWRH
jgi:hypothetical protein